MAATWIKLAVAAFGSPAGTVLRVDTADPRLSQLLNAGLAAVVADPGGTPPSVPAPNPGGDYATDAELLDPTTALGAALKATAGAPPNTVVILGDSITAKFGPTNGAYGADSYWLWAQRFLGQRMQLLNNAGVIGDTSGQVLARFDTDVAPYKPAYVVVLAGRNDGASGAATTEANLAAIYDKCAALGAVVVACTLPPGNALAAGQRAANNRTNQWIKRQAQIRRNFLVCDWGASLQDINGNFVYPTVTPDGTHPNPLGAQRMGRVLAAVLAPRVPAVDRLVSNSDDPDNLTTNPLMLGAGGDVNTGGTGVIATNWQAGLVGSGGAFTVAQVPCTDLPGLAWQELNVTATGGAGGGQVFQYCDPKLGPAAGNGLSYVARAEVEADIWTQSVNNANYGYGLSLRLAAYDSGWGGVGLVFDNRAVDPHDHEVNAERMVLETPPMQIPAGTAHLFVGVNLCAVGKVRVRRIGVRPVLTPADL